MESCKVLIRACAAYDKATFLESTASSPAYISLLKQNFEPYMILQRCALDEAIFSKTTYRPGNRTRKDHSRDILFEDNFAKLAGAIDGANINTNVVSNLDVAALPQSRALPAGVYSIDGEESCGRKVRSPGKKRTSEDYSDNHQPSATLLRAPTDIYLELSFANVILRRPSDPAKLMIAWPSQTQNNYKVSAVVYTVYRIINLSLSSSIDVIP